MGKTKGIFDLLGKPIGALGDLLTSKTKKETVDPTRRKIIAGTVAAPIAAGALSGIPQKVAQKVSQAPSGVKISESDISEIMGEFEGDLWERQMSVNTFDFDEDPKKYIDFMREIFSEKTGLAKSNWDDFFLGERAIQNKLAGYDSIEDYAIKILGKEDAQKFLKKNKVDLNFYKTADISAEDASADLRRKLVKNEEFEELSESFGEFNAENNLDSDFSVEPLFKDEMLKKAYGKGDMDWEKFVQNFGQKTSRFKELKKVIDEIDALAEAKFLDMDK
jgi:hypothetical protein